MAAANGSNAGVMDESTVMSALRKMFGQGGGGDGKPGTQGKPGTKPGAPGNLAPDKNLNNPESMKEGLDLFSGLFDTTPKEGAPVAPKFAINPETLSKAAGSLDFTKSLPPELLAKIQAGDGPSMMEGMQMMARQAYSTAIQHTTGVADQYINSRLTYENDHVMPKRMREMLAMQSGGEDDAVLDNPVVKSHLKLITSNLATQFPDADPKWLGDKAREYFTEMARAVNPKAFAATEGDVGNRGNAPGKVVDFDWGKDGQSWLEGGKPSTQGPGTGELPS